MYSESPNFSCIYGHILIPVEISCCDNCGENDDYSVLNVTTIFDNDGKELKKLLNIGLGKENQVILNIQVDSASPVSFLKKNVLHELKLRDPYLKIYPVDKSTSILWIHR